MPRSTLSSWPDHQPGASSCHRSLRIDVVTLRPADLHRLAAQLPERWRPMVYVAGACGLRFSEVAGLRVGRVDTPGHRLRVLETAPQVGGERRSPRRCGTTDGPDAGTRRGGARRASGPLRAQRRQRRARFTAERGGRLNAANWHKRAWVTARAHAGFPSLRFHALRVRHEAPCTRGRVRNPLLWAVAAPR
jgi:integrase